MSGARLRAACSALPLTPWRARLALPGARLLAPSPAPHPPAHSPSDCGVFVCMCADFTSQGLPLQYTQDDMENARLRIGLSILRGQVLD